jgi:hypothetical protein
MRSPAVRGALLAFLAGVVVLLVVMATDKRHLAFSLGVRPATPGVVLVPAYGACQRDVDVEASFDSATLLLASYYRPGPRLEFRVLDSRSGRTIATGVLPDGYPDSAASSVRFGRVIPTGRRIDLCMRNAGRWKVALFSGPPTDNEPSYATVGRLRIPADILVDFNRRRPRSALSLVPDIFRRAVLFHPRWVGSWTFWVLAGIMLLVVPSLLSLALRAATRSRPPGQGPPD